MAAKKALTTTASREQLDQAIANEIPRVNVRVEHTALEEGCRRVIKELRPDWASSENLRCKELTEGMTNKLMLFWLEGSSMEPVILRVYGNRTEMLIDREQELANMTSVFKAGEGPEVYGSFENGLVYGFIHGSALDVEDLSDAKISKLVARGLSRFHKLPIPGDQSPQLFPILYKWLDAVPPCFEDPVKQAKFEKNFDMAGMKREVDLMLEVSKDLDSPVVFCHNDLLCKNVIINKENTDVKFIDYDYANYSFQAFDLGNHFCEFAGMEEPVDYSRYPTRDFQIPFLRSYLAAYRGVSEAEVQEADVLALYRASNKFALAAHLYWGLWAIVQAHYSSIDYDYLDYALVRFTEYFKRKDEFFAL